METQSNHFEVIHSIISNDNLTAEEQIKVLNEFKTSINFAIEKTEKALMAELMYCPKCDDYYRKQSFEKTVHKEKCKSRGEENKYFNFYNVYPCYICPKGHKIIDDYE